MQYTDPLLCQAACTADAACAAYTYEANRPTRGTCTLKNFTALLIAQLKYTAGIKAPAPVGSVAVQVGTCAEASQGGAGGAAAAAAAPAAAAAVSRSFPLRAGDTSLSLRILADRSVADFFVADGRWSGTLPWLDAAPRAAGDSAVALWSTAAGIVADVDVFAVGCGWADPSWTDTPKL